MIAQWLSTWAETPANRNKIKRWMISSKYGEHALKFADIVSFVDLNASFRNYSKGNKVKISFTIETHYNKFIKNPQCGLIIAYAPLADDQLISAIVGYIDGAPLELDAWDAPDIPTIVISFEPIYLKNDDSGWEMDTFNNGTKVLSNGNGKNLAGVSSENFWGKPKWRAFEVLVSCEPWFLRPLEIYLKVKGDFYGNGSYFWWRVPLEEGDNPCEGSCDNYKTVSRENRWKIFPCEGINMARIGASIDSITMWEDDSHGFECCSDDYLGLTYAPFNYFPRVNYCPDQDLWYPDTLWRNGQQSAWIKFYDRYW